MVIGLYYNKAMTIFANTKTATQIIKKLYPDAKNVRFIEHGYDNLVGLVDDKYAFRFPRMQSAYMRSQYERLVLLDLAPLTEVTIPRVLGEGDNPPYVITSFVPGEHISSIEINKLSEEQQKSTGKGVARFAYAMHSLLSPKQALEQRKRFGLDSQEEEPWDVYFEKVINKQQFPTPEQDKLAKDYYNRWKNLKFTTSTVVIHDDLHTENLLFENGELVGVLDFGDTNIGTPEQELRQMYRINETVLQAAVDEYERLSGYKLNLEAVKVWSIIQELSAYSERLFSNNKNHPAFSRAARNLQRWLPDGNWESLLKDTNPTLNSKQ